MAKATEKEFHELHGLVTTEFLKRIKSGEASTQDLKAACDWLKTNDISGVAYEGNPLDKLNKINGYTFDWIEKEGVHSNKGHDIGVIAQEIEEVLPEIVVTRENGYKAVRYEKIISLLIESNKDLLRRIEILENNLSLTDRSPNNDENAKKRKEK